LISEQLHISLRLMPTPPPLSRAVRLRQTRRR